MGEVELDVSRTQLKLESLDYSLTVRARTGPKTGGRTAVPGFVFFARLEVARESACGNGRTDSILSLLFSVCPTLQLTFPRAINEETSGAKFLKKARTLKITATLL